MAATFYNPLVILIDVTQAGGAQSFTSTRPFAVIDASAYVTTAAAVVTTAQVSTAAGNTTDAFSLGNNTAGQIGRAGTITAANGKVAAGAVLTVTQGGAATASRVCVTARADD